MNSIPFYDVINRRSSLQGYPEISKISFGTVNNNLNLNNLLLFTESKTKDMNTHCSRCINLYDKLLETTTLSEQDKNQVNRSILCALEKCNNLDAINDTIFLTKNLDKDLFFEFTDKLENCDRVIRNEERLAKRFNLSKIIKENRFNETKHTVYELCSLIDTYDMSPKAKFNIALENVSFALYENCPSFNKDEVTEYVVEYFLTRDPIITDKQYKGYVHVLEHDHFIDSSNENLNYVFEGKNTKGNSYKDKANHLIDQCEDDKCKTHMKQIHSIKNEKDASKYIDTSVEMIISDHLPKTDSLLLLKSIYTLPLIGNVSSDFVNYKVEMSKRKNRMKEKFSNLESTLDKLFEDTTLIECAEFISEGVYFEDYILDDGFKPETNIINILEATEDEDIKKIIDTFKASNEKSPSKFRNMITRIMTKSPENIINETPSIFAVVRIMMYLGIAGAFPLGPVFAAILALVDKFVTMRMDERQAEKMLKHFKSEKEKAEKKLAKLSGKEKENQEDYIKCLDRCISKVKDFLSKINDENEELNNDDDFDFGDDDFSFESAVLESGTIFNPDPIDELINMIDESTSVEVLEELSVLFDNCPESLCDKYYDKLDEVNAPFRLKYRNTNRIMPMDESSLVLEYEAMYALSSILNEAKKEIKKKEEEKKEFKKPDLKKPFEKVSQFIKPKDKPKDGKHDKFNLATLKMAVVNFRQKVKDLKGKEQELWRNIDIATSQLSNSIQKALTSDRREAIIKGSVIPSFSKCIKFAISVGAIGAFTGPVGAAISAVGMLGASKALNERERRLLYDEIDTELQVVDKQIQMAENEGNMNQYRFLLNYQKKLIREKQRIKYGIKMAGRSLPDAKGGSK